MAQVPGLGLDQSQLADVINQQYKGYSQKQRNQMMQSAAATPDNWGAITQQANKTATQPSEYLGAGRTSNIPIVSKDGQQWQRVDSEAQQDIAPWMQSNYTAPYQNEFGSYYDQASYEQYQNAVKARDWVNTYINPTSQDTPIQSWQQLMDTYGQTPSGGWSDANTKNYNTVPKYLDGLVPNPEYSREKPPLQRWQDDASYLPNFSLYGSGSPEDIQRGFNVLQRMSPQNIGEFWGLSPAAQKGMLENPGVALQQMRSLANPANGDWLSIGAEGGFRDINAYNWDAARGLTADRSQYLNIDDSNRGLLGSLNEVIQKVDPLNFIVEKGAANLLGYDSGLDMVRSIGEPIGNLAGYFTGGVPWGSIIMGLDNMSTGNDQALLGNVVNGALSYAGSSGAFGDGTSVLGSGVDLGSTTANTAAGNFLVNSGANYARTGDLENSLKAAAFSTASGAAGNWLGNATQGQLGEIASKALGGAASGGLNSLFSHNSPINGSLFGAMSGGLHGFLNSTDKQNNTFNKERDIQNRRQAQNLTKLAKLFVKK